MLVGMSWTAAAIAHECRTTERLAGCCPLASGAFTGRRRGRGRGRSSWRSRSRNHSACTLTLSLFTLSHSLPLVFSKLDGHKKSKKEENRRDNSRSRWLRFPYKSTRGRTPKINCHNKRKQNLTFYKASKYLKTNS